MKLRRRPALPRLPRFFEHSNSMSSSVAPNNLKALDLLSFISLYPSNLSALVKLRAFSADAATDDDISLNSFFDKCTSSSVSPSFFRARARLVCGSSCGMLFLWCVCLSVSILHDPGGQAWYWYKLRWGAGSFCASKMFCRGVGLRRSPSNRILF